MATPEKILVVDDEKVVRDLFRVNLEAWGHEVRCAVSGKEAVLILETETFDRIYVDMMMPYMDGVELLRWIRQHHSKKTLGSR